MISFNFVFLLLVFLAFLFLLISVFLYLIIRKAMNNQFKRKVESYKNDYRIHVFHYLQNEEKEPIAHLVNKEEHIAIIELLGEYANVLDGEIVKKRLRDYVADHFGEYIKKDLKSNRWSVRMNALYQIEDFHLDFMIEQLRNYYSDRRLTAEEETQLLEMFALFRQKDLVHKLLNTKTHLSNFNIRSIFRKMDREIFSELVESFDELSKQYQLAVIDTIASERMLWYHLFLKQMLQSDDSEIQIRTLKAYAETNLPLKEEELEPFILMRRWQVKMMLSKIIGAQRIEKYKKLLKELLRDKEYIVRSEAAKAIMEFSDGAAILTEVVQVSKDRFAKDMANEWLEKERIGDSY
ncbi:hypothetical protein ABET51_12555 [Metabacillus fastidiosus]|uniref:hypothetical protein n=1 Tax=Metabacillus fastidiosus TaxID=1458 RepID=UPI003D28E915